MKKLSKQNLTNSYARLLGELSSLLEDARRQSARSVNALMTAAYWFVGMRIVEFEQAGKTRAEYGEQLLKRLSSDLTRQFGRGFSADNIETMRLFYLSYQNISRTPSGKSETSSRKLLAQKSETLSRKFDFNVIVQRFQLSWSHYVHLVRRVSSSDARSFYEAEALRGGWSVRQLDRQIATRFYERAALSKNKIAMLKNGAKQRREDIVTIEEEIKDPYVLEFLGLKDEYSESELEEALVRSLEQFLLELGSDFTFVGRQKRLRIGNGWHKIDLLFFHRKLRSLVVIDLKVGKFTHADAGQMHMYLNYAREHWTHEDENPPVGLILCAEHDSMVAKYALEGLPNKILASEYKLLLPKEKILTLELLKTRKLLEKRNPKTG